MNPTDHHHWATVIEDLSFDEFLAVPLTQARVQRGICEACGHYLTPRSYAVSVELPIAIDGMDRWHFFGDLCWDCVLTVVANGGYPVSWNSYVRELDTSTTWDEFGDL